MEKMVYCRHCNEEHIASETMDTNGEVVGLFCNRQQSMIVSNSTIWNDEDVGIAIERFANANVDSGALSRIKPEKVIGLSRKITYLFCQTSYAKERKINYFFAQHHMFIAINKIKNKVTRNMLKAGF